MANGHFDDKLIHSHSDSHIDPGQPASFTWQRQLNSDGKLPSMFSFTLRDVMHLGPVGFRQMYYSKEDIAAGKAVIFDVSKKYVITNDHGVPLGGIGAGSIGRSYRGGFQNFKLFPRICEEAPVLENQFSVFVSRPNGEKFSTVLCPRGTGVVEGEKTSSSIESWDWNLNEEKCTYNALFPRAWTTYDGVPDPELKIVSRQISPFIPNNYKESSFPVSAFTYTISNTGKTSADVTLLFTWANSVGGDSGFSGGHVNSKIMNIKDGIKGVTLHHSMGHSTIYYQGHDSSSVYFIFQHGSFDNLDLSENSTSAPGSCIGAAIAASLTIPSGSVRTVTFSLAWDCPQVIFSEKTYYRWNALRYTRFYGTLGSAAAKIAHDAILDGSPPNQNSASIAEKTFANDNQGDTAVDVLARITSQEIQPLTSSSFKLGQRVHSSNDPRRIGTVKYVGPVEGYSGTWIGIDWDDPKEGKHDGSLNNIRYFDATSANSASFVRPHNLTTGISFLQALRLRYLTESTKEEEDEMYVLSSTSKRVSVQLVGKQKIQDKVGRFDELTAASLSFLGISNPGSADEIRATLPSLKELDLTGNLLTEWKDVGTICEQLPSLQALNLSYNLMVQDVTGLPLLKGIRVLVLNSTGINWTQVEMIKSSLPIVEELHLKGNNIRTIEPKSSNTVEGFDFLRLLNLDDNCISEWKEVLKLSQLKSLEQLYLNKNKLTHIFYSSCESHVPFQNLCCLLLGGNNIEDMASVDSLNHFPNLIFSMDIKTNLNFLVANVFPAKDIRLSENPVADPGRGGIPRFVLIARLAKVEMLNGSEVRTRERKESEIRYTFSFRMTCYFLFNESFTLTITGFLLVNLSVFLYNLAGFNNCPQVKQTKCHFPYNLAGYVRLVMSKMQGNSDEINHLHPRFSALKEFYGLDDERPSNGTAGPQKMASGLLSITLKCVGASMGEKHPVTKKLPSTTTVGKLKILCESFFKLKSIRPKLFLQEEGSPFPTLLDDEMASLADLGVETESTILVDEET
ncbi:hypothetical protein ACFE04_006437 [Oxalis oulophora]